MFDGVYRGIQYIRKLFGLRYIASDGRVSGFGSGVLSDSNDETTVSPLLKEAEFHYKDFGDSGSKYVSQGFNQICSEEGVQVTVTLDPQTYKNLLHIKNVSEKIVKIMLDEKEWLIWPDEEKAVLVPYGVRPYLVAINNGNTDA